MSAYDRAKKKVRKAIDKTSDYIDRALESVDDYSLHVKYFHREVSDVWRRDDRLKKKYEDRAEREEASYQAEMREKAYLREANAAARLSRVMFQGAGRIGEARSMTGNPLSESIGTSNFMNRLLGGGA